MIVGQSVIPDESVLQSAQNATEAVQSWVWAACSIDLSRMHVHFQVRSLADVFSISEQKLIEKIEKKFETATKLSQPT